MFLWAELSTTESVRLFCPPQSFNTFSWSPPTISVEAGNHLLKKRAWESQRWSQTNSICKSSACIHWIKSSLSWWEKCKDHVYRMWKVEGRCTQLTSSSLHTYIIIGWHKSIVSSDWSDTIVWFDQILLYLTFTILYTCSLGWIFWTVAGADSDHWRLHHT